MLIKYNIFILLSVNFLNKKHMILNLQYLLKSNFSENNDEKNYLLIMIIFIILCLSKKQNSRYKVLNTFQYLYL